MAINRFSLDCPYEATDPFGNGDNFVSLLSHASQWVSRENDIAFLKKNAQIIALEMQGNNIFL